MLVYAIIKPNTKHREGVIVAGEGALMVYTKAPAIEGRANRAAERLIAEHYGVSKGRVRLAKGQASKYKTFEVDMPSDVR